VSGGTATFAMTKGTNTGSYLGTVSAQSADVQTAFSLSSVPTGGGAMVYVAARQVALNTSYSAQVRVLADGSVGVSLVRFAGTTSPVTIGKEVVVKGLTYTAGTVLRVGVQASGSGTTDLSATVWADGTTRPATPTVTATDTTAALQGPGSVGLLGYLSGSATSPVAVRLTSFSAVPVGGTAPTLPTPPTTPANAAPTAAFTATTDALTVAVDGAGSTDADGTIASHAWDFGDGATGSGATTSHAYTAAGTYAVVLTVTDDKGATARTERTVTVTAPEVPTPPAATVVAADAFGRSVTGGLGTADAGGAWTSSAGAARQSVNAGTATFAAAKGTNTGSYLGAVSVAGADVRTTFSLSSVPTGGGATVYVVARQVAVNTSYSAQLRVLADGSVGVSLVRFAGTTSPVVIGREVVVRGLTYTAGTLLHVDVQASGSGTTNLSATVWADGTTQPTTPTVTGTDTTAALQGAGAVGLSSYLSASATSPVDIRFTSFQVTAAG